MAHVVCHGQLHSIAHMNFVIFMTLCLHMFVGKSNHYSFLDSLSYLTYILSLFLKSLTPLKSFLYDMTRLYKYL